MEGSDETQNRAVGMENRGAMRERESRIYEVWKLFRCGRWFRLRDLGLFPGFSLG